MMTMRKECRPFCQYEGRDATLGQSDAPHSVMLQSDAVHDVIAACRG